MGAYRGCWSDGGRTWRQEKAEKRQRRMRGTTPSGILDNVTRQSATDFVINPRSIDGSKRYVTCSP